MATEGILFFFYGTLIQEESCTCCLAAVYLSSTSPEALFPVNMLNKHAYNFGRTLGYIELHTYHIFMTPLLCCVKAAAWSSTNPQRVPRAEAATEIESTPVDSND